MMERGVTCLTCLMQVLGRKDVRYVNSTSPPRRAPGGSQHTTAGLIDGETRPITCMRYIEPVRVRPCRGIDKGLQRFLTHGTLARTLDCPPVPSRNGSRYLSNRSRGACLVRACSRQLSSLPRPASAISLRKLRKMQYFLANHSAVERFDMGKNERGADQSGYLPRLGPTERSCIWHGCGTATVTNGYPIAWHGVRRLEAEPVRWPEPPKWMEPNESSERRTYLILY